MQEHFFITGGSLRADAPSYVVRSADDELFTALRSGEFCYVLTPRQMGKSSLMVRTAARLREAGERVAVLDLTAIGQNVTPEQWYDGLLMRLAEQVENEDELEAVWQQNARLGPLHRFMLAVKKVLDDTPAPRRLTIFIDEIDTMRSLPFSTDEFFGSIRECYNRRAEEGVYSRLAFCLMGVATPSDLIRDTRLTPFNIGRRIELSDFTEDEAQRLATGLVLEHGGAGPGASNRHGRPLRRILYWTGGHPYLTQRLCLAVATELGSLSRASVDLQCRKLFLSPKAQERDDNLISVRERLLRGSADRGGLLGLYARILEGREIGPNDSNILLDVLRLSGLVKIEQDGPAVRNRIYARVFDRNWIRKHLPDAEVRRQREAYRRGVTRTVLACGTLIAALLGLTTWAQIQTVNARSGYRQARTALARESMAREAEREHRRVALAQGRLARSRAAKAVRAVRLAQAASRQAFEAQIGAIRESRRAELAERAARLSADIAGRDHYIASMLLIQRERERGASADAVGLLSETGKSRHRGFEWGYWHQRVPKLTRTFRPPRTEKGVPAAGSKQASDAPAPESVTAISGDGQSVVGIGRNTITVFRTLDGGFRRTSFNSSASLQRSVALSAKGSRALTVDSEGRISLWDTQSGREMVVLPANPTLTAVSLSPDGQLFLAADANGVTTYNASARKIGEQKGLVTSALAFSRDGRRAASGAGTMEARVWDVATGAPAQRLDGSDDRHEIIAFDPTGERMVTADGGNRVILWDLETGRATHTLQRHSGKLRSLGFSPDGKLLVTACTDRTIRVWDVMTGEQFQVLPAQNGALASAAFLPDGRRIVCGYTDGTVCIWELQRKSASRVLPAIRDANFTIPVEFSRDGRKLLTLADDGTLRIWDAKSGRPLHELSLGEARLAVPALSPDGSTVAIGTEDHNVTLWRAGGSGRSTLLRGHNGQVFWCAFSRSGEFLATASEDRTVRVWHVGSKRLRFELKGHTDEVLGVVFSPAGRLLLSGSKDGTARLWDLATGRCLEILKTSDTRVGAVSSVAISPDGAVALTGYENGSARLWKLGRTRAHTRSPDVQQRPLRVLRGTDGWVLPAGFSPDGRRIVMGRIAAFVDGEDVDEIVQRSFASVVLWDSDSGKQVLSLPDTGLGAVFSPDGSVIAVGGRDGTVHLQSGYSGLASRKGTFSISTSVHERRRRGSRDFSRRVVRDVLETPRR